MTTKVAPQLINQSQGIGYTTGVGGTQTQQTSKSTAVTLNTPVGQIVTHNASLGAGERVTFAVNNAVVGPYDVVAVAAIGNDAGDSARYVANVTYTAVGIFYVTLQNIRGSAYGEQVFINFAVIKGATS